MLETLVAGAAGALTVCIYFWYRWQRCQQALQWFYSKQSCAWSAQAETVREQLFQKAFALRRSIELVAISDLEASSEHLSTCLTLSAAFNRDLEKVSDELSEPFLEDSLPLALQYFVKHWNEASDETILKLDLPSGWPQQQTVKHRLLLWCLGECLDGWQACLNPALPATLSLILNQDQGIAKLQVTFSGQILQGVSTLAGMNELSYIQQVFQMLMPGRCQLKCNDSQLVGEFRWSLGTKR